MIREYEKMNEVEKLHSFNPLYTLLKVLIAAI